MNAPIISIKFRVAKKLNTPSMSIYLKEKEDGYSNDEILALRNILLY
jgi:hypothetical protein